MNFIQAVQHATIGYGIRRADWTSDAILYMEPKTLGPALCWVKNGRIANLGLLDIRADDWETV